MFGFLTAATAYLTPEELARYKSCYCGLCRSLQERHGFSARLTLNSDMTFLVLLLQSLYEPNEHRGTDTCPPHPFRARDWQRSSATDYAADQNLLLARLKALDDWQDDGNLPSLAASAVLKKSYEKLCIEYPRQHNAISEGLEELRRLEQNRIEDPDAAAGCFGHLLGEIFVWRDDRWSGTLRALGEALGRFVYVMDACMDLNGDTVYGRFNPFRRYYGLADNEARFRDMLKMLMGDCLLQLDRLPLVQDAGLLKNILCIGVWTQFDRKFKVKKDTGNGSGSV